MVDNDYRILSVEPTDPPPESSGRGWYRYVIRQGKNTIRGYQRGDIDSVTQALQDMVVRLNDRRYGKSGRVHLTMSPQSKSRQK